MQSRALILVVVLAVQAAGGLAIAAEAGRGELDARFRDVVRPFVGTYCVDCHGGEKPKGDFDLAAFSTLDKVVKAERQWGRVLEKLKAGEMPPDEAKRQPAAN